MIFLLFDYLKCKKITVGSPDFAVRNNNSKIRRVTIFQCLDSERIRAMEILHKKNQAPWN